MLFTQSCPILCDPMDCSTPGFLVLHYLPQSFLKLLSIELMISSNHLILCCPLFLLPSISPSIRVFSNESVLHIRWPKYWSFSFGVSLSNDYSELISFRIDWFDFAAQRMLFLELYLAVTFGKMLPKSEFKGVSRLREFRFRLY